MSLDDARLRRCGVCRKLALRPRERVVEAGCGWGTFALFMARECGVSVKAYNISHEQISEARRLAQEQGLADRVEFIEDDYRSIQGRFDVFVSIGMLEHVGLAQLRVMGGVMDRVLGADGRGLLHFIGRDFMYPLNPWIRKRIFPGAYTPTLTQVPTSTFRILVMIESRPLTRGHSTAPWFDRHSSPRRPMFDESFMRA
jgi:cyclopropane-fatty-acyl-phospholipid synthase